MALAEGVTSTCCEYVKRLQLNIPTVGILYPTWDKNARGNLRKSSEDFFMAKNTKAKQREYDAKRAGQRTRNWTVIFYPEDLPADWQAKVDRLMCRWIEGPLHDQDVYTAEDEAENSENKAGTPKKKHVHTLFMFDSIKSKNQVSEMMKSIFGENENGAIPGVLTPSPCSDRSSLVRYMAHLDHPNKAQYDVKDIKGHNGADPSEVMRFSATETIQMMIAMEEYIEHNKITELADFSRAIRYDYPEWYTILATKQTRYFSDFIRSCRHKVEREISESTKLPSKLPKCDPTTGEVLE